jgi:hypothetical protein
LRFKAEGNSSMGLADLGEYPDSSHCGKKLKAVFHCAAGAYAKKERPPCGNQHKYGDGAKIEPNSPIRRDW